MRVTCEGEPVRISTQVTMHGTAREFERIGDEGNRIVFRFCPTCGSTVSWTLSGFPDLIAVAVGNFADRDFPAPRVSVYERRRHPWVIVPDHPEMQHLD